MHSLPLVISYRQHGMWLLQSMQAHMNHSLAVASAHHMPTLRLKHNGLTI
jgi:hypothetical protein